MAELILVYSYGGSTLQLARQEAQQRGAALCEVKYAKKPSMPGTFFRGCPAAIRHKPARILPIEANLADYDKLVLMAPVWAGNPALPFNNMVEALPQGREVEVILLSGGGSSSAQDAVRAQVEARGCTLLSYTDVKAGSTS